MRRRRTGVLALVVLVVLAGCATPYSQAGTVTDPDRELGVVEGYAAGDTIEIADPNRLTRAELEAITYRSMARIEVIRGLRFTEDVELEVYTREEIRDRFDRGDEPADAFTNELWRGAFVVDGETDVNDEFNRLYGDSVQGFYQSNTIVVVTDDPEAIRISRRTLVHELTHALQDQQFGLRRSAATLDERRAQNGLIEGEANYIPYLYAQRCDSEWQCLPPLEALEEPDDSSGDDDDEDEGEQAAVERPFNVGLFLSVFAPYAEGPTFVQYLHETHGWAAVDAAFDAYPTSTSQIIHPERYPDDQPVEIDIEDRSSGQWVPITDDDGEVRTETVGEATLFSTLWAGGAIDRPITAGGSDLSPYNYSHPATSGWAGDTFVAYEHTADDRVGHVWSLEWRSEASAERFAAAYGTLLENHGGESVAVSGPGEVYRIDDGEPFAGAYRVTVDGTRVELVGAPTVETLEEVRAVGAAPASVAAMAVHAPPTSAAL